jgi:hypothetical protein
MSAFLRATGATVLNGRLPDLRGRTRAKRTRKASRSSTEIDFVVMPEAGMQRYAVSVEYQKFDSRLSDHRMVMARVKAPGARDADLTLEAIPEAGVERLKLHMMKDAAVEENLRVDLTAKVGGLRLVGEDGTNWTPAILQSKYGDLEAAMQGPLLEHLGVTDPYVANRGPGQASTLATKKLARMARDIGDAASALRKGHVHPRHLANLKRKERQYRAADASRRAA